MIPINPEKFNIKFVYWTPGTPYDCPGYTLYITKTDDKAELLHSVKIYSEEPNLDWEIKDA